MAVTISDVAARAGVSLASVSLVLNNKPGVGKEARERILKAAQDLNYKPSGPDKRRSERTGTVQFLRITKHGHILNKNHNGFIAEYAEGIERAASVHGLSVEMKSFDTFDSQAIFGKADSVPVDGIIVLGTELDESDIEKFTAFKVPVVFIDAFHDYGPFDFVDMNNQAAVFSIVSYLKKMGHSRIGLVRATLETPNFRLREESFFKALKYFGLPSFRDLVFSIDSTYEASYEDMRNLLRSDPTLPTALFCVCDIVAYGCMRALKEKGIRIPRDISIIGFDNLPSSAFTDPPLTSVDVSKRLIGRKAMDILAQRIKNPTPYPFEKTLIGSDLVIRESVRENS